MEAAREKMGPYTNSGTVVGLMQNRDIFASETAVL